MSISGNGLSACVLVGALAIAVTAYAQGVTDMKKGEGGSAVQGSAGPGGAQDAASDLERCDKPMATMAVVEPQSYVVARCSRYRLGSPTGLIRLMIQQSNCFLVVERGVGMQNLMQERALAKAGELRQDSNVGGGQMVTADYVLTPGGRVLREQRRRRGRRRRRGIGGLFGSGGRAHRRGGRRPEVQGGPDQHAARRRALQPPGRRGRGQRPEGRLPPRRALRRGRRGARCAGLGGYANTNEGKVIAASFADNYNGIVRAVRGNPSLQRNVGTLATEAGTALTKAGAVFNEGDVLRPKIANVQAPGEAL